MKLDGVSFNKVESSLIPEDLSKLPRAQKRIMELLRKGSSISPAAAKKTWSLDFRLSPSRFNATSASMSRISSVSFETTSLEPNDFDLAAKAKGTGHIVEHPASFAFRSIGYKSEALPGLADLGIPFDDRMGVIPNDGYGRVVHSEPGENGDLTTRHIPKMYCAGWVKRGPTGVIASTMADAFQSAEIIANDWNLPARSEDASSDHNGLSEGWDVLKGEAERRNCRAISWHDWKKIDKSERERGRIRGKETEKFTSISEMLAVLN
jgi:adrenodoxin-NADP+ reductase